jgi:hypothetical protein
MKGRADLRMSEPYKEGNTGHGPTPARVVPGGGMMGGRGFLWRGCLGRKRYRSPRWVSIRKKSYLYGFSSKIHFARQ